MFYRTTLLALSLCGAPQLANAADEEVEIYTDSLNDKGELGLDIHSNYVATGDTSVDYAGAEQSVHRLRITPEFSYGLGHGFEAGVYLPLVTIAADGVLRAEGGIARIKWIAPHKAGNGFFWGGNFEIGRTSLRLDQNPWNAEIKGIIGVHLERWTLAANSNFNFKVSGPVSSPATLSILTKMQYRLSPKLAIGIENYNHLGAVHHFGPLNTEDQASYAVLDTRLGHWSVHYGVGIGYGGNKDHLIGVVSIGVPLPQFKH